MRTADLRAKTEKALLKELSATFENIEKSITDLMQGKSKNTSKVKNLRRDVARLKTVLAEKKILAEMELVEEDKETKDV